MFLKDLKYLQKHYGELSTNYQYLHIKLDLTEKNGISMGFLIFHTYYGLSYNHYRYFGEHLDLGVSRLYVVLVLSVCFAVTGVARRWMGLADPATESTPPRVTDSKPFLHQATL